MPLTAQRPSQELVNIVAALGGTWSGYVAMCRCPAHADSYPSLSIRQGDRSILVTCFAGCNREDVLRELRRVRPKQHFAIPDPANLARAINVERIWDQGSDVRGTLAERYLARRHLLPPPADLRFHPRCPYLPKPKTVFLPALLVAVREFRKLVAIQRIFLDPESADYTRKVMLGTPLSGAWRGRAAGATLAIAEGFETADAFMRLNDIPCWASLGARRLDQLTIPASVTTLLIAEDNDPEGRRAAVQAQEHYARDGLDIRRFPPPPKFKDWAEVLDGRSLLQTRS
ncbi:virulence-associated protein E [Sphingomonas gei]|uniref:Virulence-associated protein E n=1 Tax=Sphingomonas gei TaxID=1395960 RepID=A0A4V3QY61_9SPHN|nr:toprim domain-containing protein [Sphingomonas gei]TGX49072.1 virulence-associated protein E [Sphingomonas gei]